MRSANINIRNHIVGASPEVLAKLERKLEELDFAQAYQWQAGDRVRFDDVDLRGILFHDLDFDHADFKDTDLSHTIFCGCDFTHAFFKGANMDGAKFVDCEAVGYDDYGWLMNHYRCFADGYFSQYMDYFEYEECVASLNVQGEVLGYKAVLLVHEENRDYGYIDMKDIGIAELVIPADAKKLIFAENKCRASKAKVVEIRHWDTGEEFDTGWSALYGDTEYTVGEIVEADGFDPRCCEECSNGIHFFLSTDEAIAFAKRHTAPD